MQTSVNRIWVWIILIALHIMAMWLAYSLLTKGNSISIPDSVNEKDLFGSTDWITWENSPEGLKAATIHPLIEDNPLLKDVYVREGDVLVSVDYVRIYDKETLDELIYHASPGTVFLYQVKRQSPYSFEPHEISIFVESGFLPTFSFTENTFLWSFSLWWIGAGLLFSLVSLLILFPLLKTDFSENWTAFALLLSGFILFSTLLFHQVSLLVRSDYAHTGFEKYFTLFTATLILITGCLFLLRSLTKKNKWAVIFPTLSGAIIIYLLSVSISENHFFSDRVFLTKTLFTSFLALVLTGLIISVLEKWKFRSLSDKIFHLLSIVYSGTVLGSTVFISDNSFAKESSLLLFSMAALFIPLISSATSQMKFGRVSLVLTQSLQYFIFAIFVLTAYVIIHQSFNYFNVRFRYRNLIEISVLILFVLMLLAIFRSYGGRFRNYIISSQQKKEQALKNFISEVPTYSSSADLISRLESELSSYLGGARVSLASQPDDLENPWKETLINCWGIASETLSEANNFWSANKQLSHIRFETDIENSLQQSGISQIHTMAVRGEEAALLCIGFRGRKVYNLSDVEAIQRVIQPTRLTMGVLHLIEREKLLLEKNYEANLTALRSQINPHFLFNTLNTISSLIHDSPDDAEAATEKLAFIFRYTLKHSSRALVSLAEELSLVKTYLDIEHLRFGDRLHVTYHIDPEASEVEIPAFAVQTLIENCVKHGTAKVVGKGEISISASIKNGEMVCVVTDNGPGIDLNKINSSTGLNNIITRLEQIYQSKNLLYFENTGNGTCVTMKIPIQNG